MKMAQFNSDQMSIAVGITESSQIIFESGQKRCGPPENWTRPIPGKGCEIFIAKIPKDCSEKELIPILKEIGEIYLFRLMMETETIHRGFGFCVYTDVETAKEAVNKLNNYQIKKNWYLGVCFSVDNCRLFVGGIPKLKTKSEILEEMSLVTENVVDIIVYPSAADKHKNRGFAFVEYTNHKAAAIARKKMITNGVQLWGHTIAVDWAEPERKVEDEIMQKVKILYVRNLMLTTSEETICQVFSQYAVDNQEIIKVKKIGDFAFVHFKSREQAEIVKNKTHGSNLEGSIIEVHFAKPVNKIEQQQKRLKKTHATLNQALPLIFTNEFSRLSISSNNNQQSSPELNDRNGLNVNRTYRNAAGRCSIKSKQMIKYFENTDYMSNHLTTLLYNLCQRYGWGIPLYTVQFLPLIFPNAENNAHFFNAQVYIPGLNLHFPSKSPAFSQDEAILNVSQNALQWLVSNGIPIPPLLENLEKNEFVMTNDSNKISSESDSFRKHSRSSETSDSLHINNNLAVHTNPSQYFMPHVFQYNPVASVYNNNYAVPNSFYPSMDINDYKIDNTDHIAYPSQNFQKG